MFRVVAKRLCAREGEGPRPDLHVSAGRDQARVELRTDKNGGGGKAEPRQHNHEAGQASRLPVLDDGLPAKASAVPTTSRSTCVNHLTETLLM